MIAAVLLFARSAFGTAFAWLKKVPWYVLVIAALLAWGAIEHAEARHQSKLKDNAIASVQIWRDTNATNYRSALSLLDVAAFYANQTKLRGKAYADSKSTDAANDKENEAKRKADASRESYLEGVRDHAIANPTCAVPKGVIDKLGGL